MSTTNTARRDRANEAYQIYMGKNNPKKSPQPPQFNPYTKLIMPTTLSGYLVSMEYTNPNPYQWHTLICGDKTIIEFGIEYRRDEGLQTDRRASCRERVLMPV